MMTRLTLLLTSALFVLGSLASIPAQADQTVSPRLFSAKRTGDSYWLRDTRTAKNSTLVTQGGNIVSTEQETSKSVFEANVTVIKNNAVGKSTEERFDVIEFTVSEDNAPATEMLPAGTRFICKFEKGKKVFVDTDGQPLSQSLFSYLAQIISLRDNSITDDDIFAPDQPVSVGETWPINADLAAEDLNYDMTLQCDAKYLKGTVTLLDRPTLNGVPCNLIQSQMEVSRIKLPLQKDLRLLKGDLSFKSEIWMPQEGPAFPVRQDTEMKIVFIGDPPKQNTFTPKRLMSTTEISATIESKPLPRDESVTELDRTLGIRR